MSSGYPTNDPTGAAAKVSGSVTSLGSVCSAAGSSSGPGRKLCAKGCSRVAFAPFKTCCTHCQGPEGPHAKDCSDKAQRMVVIRVLRTTLNRSFDKLGRSMELYVIVEWLLSTGTKVEIGRTQTVKENDKSVEWDHMTPPAPYSGGGKDGSRFVLRVMKGNFGSLIAPTLCGEASLEVEQLLNEAAAMSPGLKSTQPTDLKLLKNGAETGTLTVQLLLHSHDGDGSSGTLTSADPSLFKTPVKRLGVSGGTAPFFELLLTSPQPGFSPTHWIGKDLSHATDEVGFYEQIKALQKRGNSGFDPMFAFMFDYAGVLECVEENAESSAPAKQLQLLVLKNLRDGCEHLRMLDIKIGEKTAAAGWQGKSALAALRQGIVDGVTNSQAEGFRLEGFDGPPAGLRSLDPLLDVTDALSAVLTAAGANQEKLQKKAMRVMLQRMPASEMLLHFIDVHQVPGETGLFGDSAELSLAEHLSPVEYAEVVLSEVAEKLSRLAIATRTTPAPQKWIGSSVALGFDDRRLPRRTEIREKAETELRKSVLVNIFDWGRSELNTLENHITLSPEMQADRKEFWQYYAGGIDRLSWEAARAYWHHFGNADEAWKDMALIVYDFDSSTPNEYIGQAQVNMDTAAETTVPLCGPGGTPLYGKGGPATITYSVVWRELPKGARLRGSWRICVVRAANLPCHDVNLSATGLQSSDPFVAITVTSNHGTYSFRQDTSVVVKNVDPVWNETFDVPVAANAPGFLEKLVGSPVKNYFPASSLAGGDANHAERDLKACSLWRDRLRQACGKGSLNLC